jgi:hypothetical protein
VRELPGLGFSRIFEGMEVNFSAETEISYANIESLMSRSKSRYRSSVIHGRRNPMLVASILRDRE